MSKFILELDTYQAETLRTAVRDRLNALDIHLVGETPHAVGSLLATGKWYAPHSHMDGLVRLYARLTRILTGHKQYNAEIQFSEQRQDVEKGQ